MIWLARRRPIRLRRCADRQRGFTLLEVLVTLTILGLATVLIVGYKPPWSRTLGIRGAAAEIAAALRLARSEAIVRNRPIRFEIDVDRHVFQIDTGPAQRLAPELKITLLAIAGERLARQVGSIRFDPDGSSSGGRISLTDGGHTIAVGVDWLNGRVSVADVD